MIVGRDPADWIILGPLVLAVLMVVAGGIMAWVYDRRREK